MLAAVRQNGLALNDASAGLRADQEVVLAAVAQNPDALRFASAALQDGLPVLALQRLALVGAPPQQSICLECAAH